MKLYAWESKKSQIFLQIDYLKKLDNESLAECFNAPIHVVS